MRFRLIESIDAEVDSEGNKLTPKQSQYFRDSQVRDHKGNLLVCYHGTENTFDTFEKGDIGFHFGTEKAANERREYHDTPGTWNVDRYYLNIKNYIDTYDFGDWDGLTVAQHILDSRLLDLNDEEIRWLQVISSSGGYYDEDTTRQVRDFLIGKGIDGFMYENAYEDAGSLSFIVFSPNQVKRVTNQSPTSSNNLDESVSNESIVNIDVAEAEDIATQFVSPTPTYQTWIDTQGRFLDASNLGSHYNMVDEVFWQLTDKGYLNGVSPVDLEPEDYNEMTEVIFDSFSKAGWIQIGLDCKFASIFVKPTREQYDAIEQYLDYAFNKGAYTMEVCIENSGFHSASYNLKEVTPEYIIKRIKRYYSSGILYESAKTSSFKFKLNEESNEIKRYYGDASRNSSNNRGSGINNNIALTSYYNSLGWTGDLEAHHIIGNHNGEICIAPKGFNSSFHSFVNDLIESRFSNSPNYKNDLTTLADIDDALKAIDKIPLSTVQRRRISSTISAGKSGISASTQNVIRTTDPYVEILFRKLLNKFINGKLSHPKLNKYRGLVFYKRTLEKKLGIKI